MIYASCISMQVGRRSGIYVIFVAGTRTVARVEKFKLRARVEAKFSWLGFLLKF